MKRIVLIAIGLTLAFTLNAYAQGALSSLVEYPAAPMQSDRNFIKFINSRTPIEDAYSDSWANKMGIGLLNTATSWADVPNQVIATTEEQDLLAGLTLGFSEGLATGVARGIAGVLDCATFGLSPYDKPLMEPEYKVDDPKGYKVDLARW